MARRNIVALTETDEINLRRMPNMGLWNACAAASKTARVPFGHIRLGWRADEARVCWPPSRKSGKIVNI